MKKLFFTRLDLCGHETPNHGNPVDYAVAYSQNGVDGILLCDESDTDESHEDTLHTMKEISRKSDCLLYGMGQIKRVEDVKKIIYAGCDVCLLDFDKVSNIEMLKEVSKRFGKEKIGVYIHSLSQIDNNLDDLTAYAGIIMAPDTLCDSICENCTIPVLILAESDENVMGVLSKPDVFAVYTDSFTWELDCTDWIDIKKRAEKCGMETSILKPQIPWDSLKKGADGLVPVVVQDYKNSQVLMVAYMNEEAYMKTFDLGLMTYYSRSRKELWTKGLTSGHVQYVKSLSADCDLDTILAKVAQIGAACHTGSRSCFFQNIAAKPYKESNPYEVFEKVYGTIIDRKIHPKEGSYTNYLFDKGLDKILKKVGEEATELVIAAKNPDPEEIKYEMSDFLYHAMVLMASKGITWEDITEELDKR